MTQEYWSGKLNWDFMNIFTPVQHIFIFSNYISDNINDNTVMSVICQYRQIFWADILPASLCSSRINKV